MAQPPHSGGAMGVLYLIGWRRNYPHDRGTRPGGAHYTYWVVFQKWRWPFLHRPSKGIAVDKQANHDVMHLRGFREADRLADQAFHTRP